MIAVTLFIAHPHTQVELKGLFNGAGVATATEMFLSLLKEKGTVTSPGLTVHIPPMEIQAYSLTWQH